MKHFCIDCHKEKSVFGIRCLSCSNKKKWQDADYRKHMENVHKVIPENLEKLITYSKSEKGRQAMSIRMKGKIAWNKGKNMPEIAGENAYQWKGDNASYRSLHRRLGKTPPCDYCGSLGGKHGNHWANLTGKYADMTDYLPLCPKHHKAYDTKKLFIWEIPESQRIEQ
jgi:hypothetical protein